MYNVISNRILVYDKESFNRFLFFDVWNSLFLFVDKLFIYDLHDTVATPERGGFSPKYYSDPPIALPSLFCQLKFDHCLSASLGKNYAPTRPLPQ